MRPHHYYPLFVGLGIMLGFMTVHRMLCRDRPLPRPHIASSTSSIATTTTTITTPRCDKAGEDDFLGLCVPRPSSAGCPTVLPFFDGADDVCRFYSPLAGIVAISPDRWKRAQSVESGVWDGNTGGEDRNQQHAVWFGRYAAVNASELGRVLELGCGPFTQTKTILEHLSGVRVTSITLVDPLMLFYHARVPSSPYRSSGSLLGHPTLFMAAGAEDALFRDEYDTVIMINVLEHCRDALRVLRNLHGAVRLGGTLILGERWYDRKWNAYHQEHRQPFWDVMHPINVKRAIIEALLAHYTPRYRRDFFYEGDYPTDEGVYFIGTRIS